MGLFFTGLNTSPEDPPGLEGNTPPLRNIFFTPGTDFSSSIPSGFARQVKPLMIQCDRIFEIFPVFSSSSSFAFAASYDFLLSALSVYVNAQIFQRILRHSYRLQRRPNWLVRRYCRIVFIIPTEAGSPLLRCAPITWTIPTYD